MFTRGNIYQQKKMDNQPNRIFFSAIKKNKLYMQIMDESFKNYVE